MLLASPAFFQMCNQIKNHIWAIIAMDILAKLVLTGGSGKGFATPRWYYYGLMAYLIIHCFLVVSFYFYIYISILKPLCWETLVLYTQVVTMLGHNTSHNLSWHIISFLFFFFTWLHHQSMDGIATDMSSLCLLLILLFLLLWSLCYSPTKLPYINCYNMFVVL